MRLFVKINIKTQKEEVKLPTNTSTSHGDKLFQIITALQHRVTNKVFKNTEWTLKYL